MSDEMHKGPGSLQEDILDQAVQRLAAGENLDAILASFGADADWLEPLLMLTAKVRALRERVPVPPAGASLDRFLAGIDQFGTQSTTKPGPRHWWENLQLPAIDLGFRRLVTASLAVMLLATTLTVGGALFLGANSTAVAQNVLPGQPLYPAKRLGEGIYLWLPQDPESLNAKLVEYEGRRREEVHLLLNRRLAAHVTFRGVVEEFDTAEVVANGISAQIVDETQVEGTLAIGARVLIKARTSRDSRLIAQLIVVEDPGTPGVTPAPTATPQPTATASATPTPTQTMTTTAAPVKSPMVEETPALPQEGANDNDGTPEDNNQNVHREVDDLANGNENGDDDDEASGNGNDDADGDDDDDDNEDDANGNDVEDDDEMDDNAVDNANDDDSDVNDDDSDANDDDSDANDDDSDDDDDDEEDDDD